MPLRQIMPMTCFYLPLIATCLFEPFCSQVDFLVFVSGSSLFYSIIRKIRTDQSVSTWPSDCTKHDIIFSAKMSEAGHTAYVTGSSYASIVESDCAKKYLQGEPVV